MSIETSKSETDHRCSKSRFQQHELRMNTTNPAIPHLQAQPISLMPGSAKNSLWLQTRHYKEPPPPQRCTSRAPPLFRLSCGISGVSLESSRCCKQRQKTLELSKCLKGSRPCETPGYRTGLSFAQIQHVQISRATKLHGKGESTFKRLPLSTTLARAHEVPHRLQEL